MLTAVRPAGERTPCGSHGDRAVEEAAVGRPVFSWPTAFSGFALSSSSLSHVLCLLSPVPSVLAASLTGSVFLGTA